MMQWASRSAHLLRRLLDRRRAENELEQEVQDYFDIMVERRVVQGLTREESSECCARSLFFPSWDSRSAFRRLSPHPGM